MKKVSNLLIFAIGIAMAILVFGCSENNPVTPMTTEANSIATDFNLLSGGTTTDGLAYDINFRDTIVSIDYSNGSFMVANQTETITTDEATFIWLEIPGNSDRQDADEVMVTTSSGSAKQTPEYYLYTRDSVLTFSDLKVGYVVEVRANCIDATTLLAGKIKVASCDYREEECMEFTDVIASVNVDLRIVTFVTEPYIGSTCLNTTFLGTDGETLTLTDFSAGENVYVKGRVLEGDTLRVNTMSKID